MPGETEVGSSVLALVKGRAGRIAVHTALVTATVGGSIVYSAAHKTVTLSVDGSTREVRALSGTVEDLLADKNVRVGPRDLVAPAPGTDLSDGDTVVVRYARPLTLTVDGRKRVYWTTELSVDRALGALGVRADGARLSASRSERIERGGLAMWLSTPKRVTVVADGRSRAVTSAAPTVSDLLAEQKLTVRPLDKLSAVPSTPLRTGLVVRLVRVVEKRVTVTESIPFPVQEKRSADLYEGDEKVVTEGRKGRRSAVYDLVITDGRTTGRTLVSSTVTRQPVTQVVEVGTKEKPASSGGGGGNVGGDVDSLNWAALADCESGGNPNAVNRAGPYYGLYQFSAATWRSVGGSGVPTDHGAGEQTYRAKLLYQRTGASSWPHCGPRLFS